MSCEGVLASNELFTIIVKYMPGKAFKQWSDAYAIVAAKYTFMLDFKPWCIPTELSIENAIYNNRLDVIEYFMTHCTVVVITRNLIEIAASEGNLKILNYLLDRYDDKSKGIRAALVYGAASGHIEVVHAYASQVSPKTLRKAIAFASDFRKTQIVQSLQATLVSWHAATAEATLPTNDLYSIQNSFTPAPNSAPQQQTFSERIIKWLYKFLT
ncbi:hypothetical protein THRCLA_22855 [Thraustotheca clavata]|uniref:Ankyrin repeat n=1 Tax=Thraustotheca clavata TaxID=74557 RepID=A0A1V9YS39_9STRA|nr:hypothetical protein THRCLA_22855 [Thraustotheca clavata]